jgi:predicted ArsR family transcriptional regulator
MSYTPRGIPRAAILALDEHGAQFSAELSNLAAAATKDLVTALAPAMAHGLLRSEPRKRPGGRGRPATLWYLTPVGARLAEQLRKPPSAHTP